MRETQNSVTPSTLSSNPWHEIAGRKILQSAPGATRVSFLLKIRQIADSHGPCSALDTQLLSLIALAFEAKQILVPVFWRDWAWRGRAHSPHVARMLSARHAVSKKAEAATAQVLLL
jgi:hypothetical protein